MLKVWLSSKYMKVADVGGAPTARAPPIATKFFWISCSFWEIFKILCPGAPPTPEVGGSPGKILDPPLHDDLCMQLYDFTHTHHLIEA